MTGLPAAMIISFLFTYKYYIYAHAIIMSASSSIFLPLYVLIRVLPHLLIAQQLRIFLVVVIRLHRWRWICLTRWLILALPHLCPIDAQFLLQLTHHIGSISPWEIVITRKWAQYLCYLFQPVIHFYVLGFQLGNLIFDQHRHLFVMPLTDVMVVASQFILQLALDIGFFC